MQFNTIFNGILEFVKWLLGFGTIGLILLLMIAKRVSQLIIVSFVIAAVVAVVAYFMLQ